MTEISTLGSHCALQVLKGAKDEGFRTLIVTERRREDLYRRFKFIDHFMVVDRFAAIAEPRFVSLLKRRDAIMIPHGTLISEVGVERIEKEFDVPIFGNKRILRWEADRRLKERLMREAKLRIPRSFSNPEEIDRLVIVKMHGARGGRGYFLANSPRSFHENHRRMVRSRTLEQDAPLYIQEYVVGVPVYLQFFYSTLKNELELLGVERRYETTVDSIGRIPAEFQDDLLPSYVVVGNTPLVLRESLLQEVYGMGERFVRAAGKLVPPGMVGPFCLEGVFNENAEFVAFEFSARIVAGTNLYTNGSPYSTLIYKEAVSMGRRIAMEIKEAASSGSLQKVIT